MEQGVAGATPSHGNRDGRAPPGKEEPPGISGGLCSSGHLILAVGIEQRDFKAGRTVLGEPNSKQLAITFSRPIEDGAPCAKIKIAGPNPPIGCNPMTARWDRCALAFEADTQCRSLMQSDQLPEDVR